MLRAASDTATSPAPEPMHSRCQCPDILSFRKLSFLPAANRAAQMRIVELHGNRLQAGMRARPAIRVSDYTEGAL
ncbi:hypothetical protein GCM10011348_31690 [Marinobacterium nitratireducens]|uniref:Uncharacterized protein n=1 Tax=Marinobacterium nitratireducens TaxID=518897 RepID=A0A917ZKW0_9GAMM|nr:hypothetical protein GCM10011348_31690 [Marinobacterium nitratireducens]